MCKTCVEIDDKIKRYHGIRARIADQFTVDRIKELIAEMEARKATLHPE